MTAVGEAVGSVLPAITVNLLPSKDIENVCESITSGSAVGLGAETVGEPSVVEGVKSKEAHLNNRRYDEEGGSATLFHF